MPVDARKRSKKDLEFSYVKGQGRTMAQVENAGNSFKAPIIAFVACFVPAILIIIFVAEQDPVARRVLPVLLFIGLVFAGAAAAIVFNVKRFVVAMRVPAAVIDSFRQIGADKTFETREFIVFRKGDIHVLVQNEFDGAYFVRLFSQAPAPAEKEARVPRVFTRFAFKDEVLDLPLAKRRGDFTIPVDVVRRGDRVEEKYVRGSGILYYVYRYNIKHPFRRDIPQDLSEKFDNDTISKIIDELSQESRHAGGKS